METIKRFILTFVLVLAGATMSSAIFISIFAQRIEFTVILLWEIIGMAMICTFGNLIYLSKYEIGKNQMKIRIFLHYVYINMTVFVCAYCFGWIDPSFFFQMIALFFMIAAVYISVMLVNFHKEEKMAEVMNEQLFNLNKKEIDDKE